jgi:cold shock CspA family protein
MATGKVLQFDPSRGYGFVAADDGGEDIFVHASVFEGDSNELVPGVPLEFEIMAGDRGRKAFGVRFAASRTATPEQARLVPQQAEPVPPPPVPPLQRLIPAPQDFSAPEEDQMCDVLSQTEFGTEITELLLNTIPALHGPQILELRQSMLGFAKKRGWVDA